MVIKKTGVAWASAIAVVLGVALATNASATPIVVQVPVNQGLCASNQALLAAPDHTWTCLDWPLAPSQTPSATPTTTMPTTPAPMASTPAPVTATAPQTTTPTTPAPMTSTPAPVVTTFKAYITGYSWYDNDPPGSAAIANPSSGRTSAGGLGTFTNPITVAAHEGYWPVHTKFYVPNLRKYFLVEDECGGCTQIPAGATAWLDVWVDGRTSGETASNSCMGKLTRVSVVVRNPPANLKVESTNPISHNGTCPTYGDAIVYA
jgi:hypothetical protein